jgi:tetratricopeptide (TPR) repeat protein
MGTPSYVAPEQARGENDLVNERADVFALGSILCEILTGSPAFNGHSSGEIMRKADKGDTADALARLDGCAAEGELAYVLGGQGKLDEAIAEYRAAIRLKPEYADARVNLGETLGRPGKLDEAIAEFGEAIRLKPELAEAHCALGHILMRQGDYARALEVFRKGHELGSKRPGWRDPSAQWVADAKRAVTLATRLPAVLRNDDKPTDVAEHVSFAPLAHDRKHFATAAHLWSDALAADPKLGDDRRTGVRYNAACVAALAAAGQGKDDPGPDDAAKAKLRGQALEWLKAELVAWTNILDTGPAPMKARIAPTIEHWKADTDLASIRDAEVLAGLPEAEWKEWHALWAEVEALVRKVTDAPSGNIPPVTPK